MGKSFSITFDENLLADLDAKIEKENKSKTKNKTTRSKLLATAFEEYNNPKKAKSKVIEKEVIVEVEKIVEVPAASSKDERERGVIERVIDDADGTTKIVWGLLILFIIFI